MAKAKKLKSKAGPPGVLEGAKVFKRDLPVALTDEESQAKGKKAAKLQDQCEEIEARLKSQGTELRAELKGKRGELRALLREVSTGEEERPVPCYERKDFNAGKVDVIRTDTGAVAETRIMDASERQEELPVPRPRKGGRKADSEGEEDEGEPGVDAPEGDE